MLERDRHTITDPEVIRSAQRLDRFLRMGARLSREQAILVPLPPQVDDRQRVAFFHTPRENVVTALSHLCANEYKALLENNEKELANEIVANHRDRQR